MVGAERRQNTTQGAEGGKADQSDPAEGGGGGAVNRPVADPVGGRTPAKAVGRRREKRRSNACKGGRAERWSGGRTPGKAGGRSDQAENKRTPAKAVDWAERLSKKVLPRSQRRRGLYITQVMGHFP